MRYFEIVKPSARHILGDVDLKEPTPGKPRIDGMKSAGNWQSGTSILPEPQTLINRPSRQRHLSPRRSQ